MKKKIIYLSSKTSMFLLFFLSLNAYTTEYNISFTGSGASSTVDSVVVQNLTQGTTVNVSAGDSLKLSVSPNALPLLNANNDNIRVFQNVTSGKSTLSFFVKSPGNTQINVFSIDGRQVIGTMSNLQEGNNSFQLALSRGAYLIQVTVNGYIYAAKFINQAGVQNKPELVYLNNEKWTTSHPQKSKSVVTTMPYTEGDLLLFKGISGNYSTIIADAPVDSETLNFEFVPCQDSDGNFYSVVKIGSQTWMAENLKTTKYRNGDEIINITDNTAWSGATLGGWCNYNNDANNGTKFGKLYNWYAVSNILDIAPVGWHVASDIEWASLMNFSGGATVAGGKLKETGTTNWKTPNASATNESGFTALPGGYRHYGGTFYDVNLNYTGDNGYWWSSTQVSTGWAFSRTMYYSSGATYQGSEPKRSGFSVRCVMDATIPTLTTSALSLTIETTGVFGGNITTDGGAAVTARGVCWSTTAHPTITDSKTTNGDGTGVFTSPISGLTEGQTYYLRAYATNNVGTAYGNEFILTTQVFNQNAVFAKIYATLGLTGNMQPAGDGDVQGVDESATSFIRLIWNLNELTTDEAICSWNDSEVPEMNFNQFTSANNQFYGLYHRLYFDITLCNRFLAETASKTDSISLKQRAETRFVRALNYYYLLDMFGNVPFTDVAAYTHALQINRANLFNYIENELAQCEPEMYEPMHAPYGRADKVANWLLRSRLYLNAEVYSGTAKWQEAAMYSKKVMDSGYTLCPTFKHLFMADNGGAFDNSTVNTAKQEIILPVYADGANAKSWGSSLFLIASTHTSGMAAWGSTEGWAGNRARATLVKKFFPTGTTFFSNPADLTTASLASLKDNRALFDKSSVSTALDITTVSAFNQGYSVIKFSNIRADGGQTSDLHFVDMDVPFLRVAEAYLTYAEAMFRTGNATNALATINQLRTRAGAVVKTSIDLPAILDEKAREFFFEGQRRTDLIRFGNYGGGTYNWDWKGGAAAGTTFDAHYNIFPIPASALNENPDLLQNPGY